MFTPSGKPAGNIDKIMLLAIWARYLNNNGTSVICAGMGKPTLATNELATSAAVRQWSEIQFASQNAHHFFRSNDNSPKVRDTLAKMGGVIDYGDPQGDLEARQIMAKALTKWYEEKVKIEPEHILFTVGGAGAIHNVLKVLKTDSPNGRIVTPFPHYSLYANSIENTSLHAINVMKQPGYRLTSEALAKSIESALSKQKKDGKKISAFLFCDPNNPLGTIVNKAEWIKIAEVLKQHPTVPIILDEAYAEMRLDGQHYESLIEIAPELQDRIIIFRSATKALSAAGQRMAIVFTKNINLMEKLIANNVNTYGHAPRLDQKVFAIALDNFSKTDREELASFYGPQVALANKRLVEMGANLPDLEYKPEGTFYAVADMSDLFGLALPSSLKSTLGKEGVIETGEDIAYYLMFKGVMLAPLCYFGLSPKNGFMRITCSGGDSEVDSVCNLLERILIDARLTKINSMKAQILSILDTLVVLNPASATNLKRIYPVLTTASPHSSGAVELKTTLNTLEKCFEEVTSCLKHAKHNLSMLRHGYDDEDYVKKIQAHCKRNAAKKILSNLKQKQNTTWESWVKSNYQHIAPLCDVLLKFTYIQRYEFKPWRDFLKENSKTQENGYVSSQKLNI